MVGAVLCLNLSVYSQLISLKMNDVSAGSYTHLDVYKRQRMKT